PEELARLRAHLPAEARDHRLLDEWAAAQAVDWSKITVPFLSVGSWGTVGLHLRGNVEAFRHAKSRQKWLMLLDADGPGIDRFLTDEGFAVQLRFLDHFLHGKDNGWPAQPAVTYEVREPDGARSTRTSATWPVERTRWTRLHLDATTRTLRPRIPDEPGAATYWPTSDGVVFRTERYDRRVEIAGPLTLQLEVSTRAEDLDLFVSVQVVAADGRSIGPTARGWLRLSHRELDEDASTQWSPVHTHRQPSEVEPGRRYVSHVEIWPTALVIPPGGVVRVSVLGRDPFDVGEWRHDDPDDRPTRSFADWATIHSGPEAGSYLLIPVVA
ncbi:MAG: CocE/NonD family hydrolase C-terminal non-catalytic domain-containing protein, partial [Acidimicrobiales bacterium]